MGLGCGGRVIGRLQHEEVMDTMGVTASTETPTWQLKRLPI